MKTEITITDDLASYLKQSVEMRKHFQQTMKMKGNGKYVCMEDFVLQHGRPMKVSQRSDNGVFTKGEMKMCFMNAQNLMLDSFTDPQSPEVLTYCEGYALGHFFPVLHAWVIDKNGEVIDPTWKDSSECVYYGVAFKRKYVLKRMIETQTHLSVIDDWEHGFPLLTTDVLEEALEGERKMELPKVGDGATISCGSDRDAGTVIEVSPSGHKIVIQYDSAKRIDDGGPFTESQRYKFKRNPNGVKVVATRRKKGGYMVKGSKWQRVHVGSRNKYVDPCF